MSQALKIGDIYQAKFPFADDPSGAKFRPVVVVGFSRSGPGEDSIVLVVPVTSFRGQAGKQRSGDVVLSVNPAIDCTLPNLEGSYVRARRLWSADPSAIDRSHRFGRVSQSVMDAIYSELQRTLRGA